MILPVLHLLAQLNESKLVNDGAPSLQTDSSYGMTWVIGGLLAAGILAITFKTTKRNHLERD